MALKTIRPDKWHLTRRLLAIATMFVSAYSVFGWMGAVARISGWTGLPKYEEQIPQLRVDADLWIALATSLPFVAALLLSLGRNRVDGQPEINGTSPVTYVGDSRASSFLFEYGLQLAVSLLGTLILTLCLFLLGLLIHVVRPHMASASTPTQTHLLSLMSQGIMH